MKLLVLLILTFSMNIFAESWTQSSFREDNINQYWVGISSEHPTEKLALNEAYQEALNEAAKFNFGFNHSVVENTYSNKTDHQIHQETQWKSERILFKGIKPLRQYVKEKNGKFIAFREISYPKDEIKEEKIRISKIVKEEKHELTKVDVNYTYGNLKVTSNVNDIKLEISKSNEPNPKVFSGPAEITLATGLYYVYASKPGYRPISREIIVSGGANFTHLNLETSLGSLNLKVLPTEATVKINNRIYNKNLIDLPEGSYKLEVAHPDFFTITEELEILNGSGIYREITLKPKKSAISVFSEPSNAQIFINGSKIGQTPLVGFQLLNDNEKLDIILIKEGYQISNKIITFQPNKTLEPLNFNLKKIEK